MTEHVRLDPQTAERASHIETALAEVERQLGARDDRISELEQRLEDQEYSVRRVLDMLIDWLEDDTGKGSDGQSEAA